MWRILLSRFKQGHRTLDYPDEVPALPDRFRGHPIVEPGQCSSDCHACVDACPSQAIVTDDKGLGVDLGRCVFCQSCVAACPRGAIRYTTEHRLAARQRDDLIVRGKLLERARALDEKMLRLFQRSLKLRVVSAGGCNACEADVNVLSTIVFDLSRFGIQYVASPRHADGLLITGTVPENMKLALKKTYDAVPPPKLVIAVGTCAISGGIYADEGQTGAAAVVPVDLYIPGCPPHPLTILDGLLALLDRSEPAHASGDTPPTFSEEDEVLKWGLARAEEALKYLGADLGKNAPERDESAPTTPEDKP